MGRRQQGGGGGLLGYRQGVGDIFRWRWGGGAGGGGIARKLKNIKPKGKN